MPGTGKKTKYKLIIWQHPYLKSSQTNNLTLYIHQGTGKRKAIKPKASKRKEIIKNRNK